MKKFMSSKYWLAAATLAALPNAAFAQQAVAPEDETIIVWGRAIDLVGEAQSASEGIVGYGDFEHRPLSRVGELVEVIPGMIATQHAGGGKANQYFLRGFNLDHGTDFSATVDGMPINLRTHGHGQGYLDLNFLIPEIVERVRYRKGPYHADVGDFSAAGTADFVTYTQLEEGFLEVAAGEFDYRRVVGANSFALGEADLLLAGEVQGYEGPWALSEDLRKLNALARYTRAFAGGEASLSFSAYESEWRSSDQVPLRAVESGLIDRFGFIDPDLGGNTQRISLSGQVVWSDASIGVYVVSSDFQLFSDFTYVLEDPVNGDEFEQIDERMVYGGYARRDWSAEFAGREVTFRLGADTRLDDISDIGLFRSAGRVRLSTVRQDEVREFSVSAFAESELEIAPSLRAVIGLRADHYDVDVDADLAANAGEAEDSIFSPKLTLAWMPADGLEFYANYGQGFHSNDARGATISIDPVSGDPANPVPLLVRAEGAEVGARWERGDFNATITGFWLELDSELVFVGDAGATEPGDATRRLGVELAAFWQPTDWLTLDATATQTNAESIDAPSGLRRIPGAIEQVVGAGAVVTFDSGLMASLRVRHFGEAPLIEDGSISSVPTTLVNLGLTQDFGPFRLGLDVLNLFDADDADITYFYESQLPPEGASVEDIHFHPVEPRQIRVSLRARF